MFFSIQHEWMFFSIQHEWMFFSIQHEHVQLIAFLMVMLSVQTCSVSLYTTSLFRKDGLHWCGHHIKGITAVYSCCWIKMMRSTIRIMWVQFHNKLLFYWHVLLCKKGILEVVCVHNSTLGVTTVLLTLTVDEQ